MIEPLNPQQLTPSASLNRLRIAALPNGVRFAPAIIDKTAYELTSTAYLAAQVRANAAQLKLQPEILAQADRELPKVLSASFESPDALIRVAAHAIIHQFGRNIGCVLLILKLGDTANRLARTDWDNSYWSHWASIRTIYCGGGLVPAIWWDEIRSAIAEVFSDAGVDLPVLSRVAHGDSLALIGASRRITPDAEYALVFDFGGSFIKRAYARYTDSALAELHRLPSLPTQFMAEGQTTDLFNFMVSTIAQTGLEVSAKRLLIANNIAVSLAAYVDPNGQPYERQGGVYAALRTLSPNVQNTLSASLAASIDAPIKVQLLHDGSAAACTYAGISNAAVIMFGTALGIGFPPLNDVLCAMSHSFAVNE
jgi:hypothetical protein